MTLHAKIQLFNWNNSRIIWTKSEFNYFLPFSLSSSIPRNHAIEIKWKPNGLFHHWMRPRCMDGWWNLERSSALWNDSLQNYYDSLELACVLSYRQINDENKFCWSNKKTVIILTARCFWGTERSSSVYVCVDNCCILSVNTFYLVWSTTFYTSVTQFNSK